MNNVVVVVRTSIVIVITEGYMHVDNIFISNQLDNFKLKYFMT